MSADSGGLSDEVSVELNGDSPEPDYGPQPDPIPDRPSDGAKKDKWSTYVVALGLHPDDAQKLSRDQLIDLADRLGG